MPVYKNDANLQGLWLMEEVSGSRLDYTPNNNDLTDNNTVASSADAQEGALSADFEAANSEYLSITDAAQTGLDITGNLSIVFWYKPESLPGAGANYQLVSKYLTTGNQRAYRVIAEESGGTVRIRVYLSSNGTAIVTAIGGTALSATTWYHIGVVYNGTDVRIYVNGALDSNGASNPLAYTGGIFNSSAFFGIGRQDAGSGYADGLVDEVGVFNRALSATEVDDIFDSGILDVTGSLIQTLGALTASAAGTVAIDGTLAKTLGALTSTGAGTVEIRGAATPTLGALAVAGAGQVAISGQAAITLGPLASTGTGAADVAGLLAQTLGALTIVGVGAVDIEGAAAVTLGPLTSSAAGIVDIAGALAKTLGDLALTGAGAADVSGALDQTLGALTLEATGTQANETAGEAAITLGALTSSAAGTVEVNGALIKTLGVLTSTGAGEVAINGALAVTLEPLTTLTTQGTSATELTGELTQTLGGLTLSAQAVTVLIVGIVTVAFSSKQPGLAFSSRQPGLAFSSRQPSVSFTED